MVNWNKIDKKVSVKKVILPIFVVSIILLGMAYSKILKTKMLRNEYAHSLEKIAVKNASPKFSIEKIYLCSSANGIDSTSERNSNVLDLYQYTDIAIYLKNYDEEGLNTQNSVKELYLDNIDISLEQESGTAGLFYTNLLKIGSKDEISKFLNTNMFTNEQSLIEKKERIDFNIINNNKENNEADYDKPTFYADCSNPISLKYINKLNKKYTMQKDSATSFNGALLAKAGVSVEELNCQIKFKINIVSNDDRVHTAWVNFKVPLDDIYRGTSIKSKNTVGKDYYFFTM